MKKVVCTLLGACLLSSTPVIAAPSVNGSTGLINSPSADVLREGQFSLGYYHLQDGGAGVFTTNIASGVELGLAGFRYDNQADNKTMVNAKIGLLNETILSPGLALGVEDIGGEKQRSAYAVASKTLPFGFRVHLGLGNGQHDGVFGGIEKSINPLGVITGNNVFPATSLIAEYDGKKYNYGARMSVIPGLKVDAGWREHDFYVGMSFTR